MRIHLNEGQLNRIVKRSVKRAINEANELNLNGTNSNKNGVLNLLHNAIRNVREGNQTAAIANIAGAMRTIDAFWQQ